MEGFVEVSPLSSAPTSVSSDSFIISNDSYVPIHSSSQILVAQDSKELINVEHYEAAVSHTNEKHMNDEKLGKKAPTVTSGLDSLDDILFQPTKTTVGGVGKFQPKPKARTVTSKSGAPGSPAGEVVPVPSSPLITSSIVAEVVSPPPDARLLSSQCEGLRDINPLCNAPTCVSSNPLTISNCSSALFNPPSQVIVAENAIGLIDFEHLKSAVSDANEKLLKNNEEFGEQEPTVTSGLNSLDDILFKPKTTARGVGKFRPKPKDPTTTSKSFTVVIPPVDMVPVLSPPPVTPSKDSNSALIDPSSKVQVVAQDADPVQVENSEAVVCDANENIQMNGERLGKQTPTVTSVSDSLDDIFFQPAKTTVHGIGKFQPKPKAPTTSSKSIAPVIPHYVVAPVPSPSTTTSNIAEFVSPPFDPQLSPQIEGLVDRLPLCDTPTSVSFDPLTTGTCFSAPIETSSQLLIDQEDANPTDDVHFKAAVSDANENSQLDHENLGMEAPTVASDVDSLEIHFQHITTAVNLPYDSTHSQHVTQQSSDRSETHLETAVAGGDGYLQTDPVTSKREGIKGRKRRTSTSVKETVGKSSTISEENEAGNTRMQLRKRKAVLSHVEENGVGIEENYNINLMNDKNGSDNEHNGEDGEDPMKRRKVPRRTKGPATKTDKPSRSSKKASDGADPIKKEPAKKKFCHSTRRNRRTVSKELLEKAEEDIDHSKLRMKDLIILAEIKERRSNKEAEALKKSFPYQRYCIRYKSKSTIHAYIFHTIFMES
ncbi:hypothetical protein AAC387_Pa03g1800 [Persea americana]